MKSYTVIGIMSGTSTDGLDIAYVRFETNDTSHDWSHQLLSAETFEYADDLAEKLKQAKSYSALDLKKLDIELGTFIGETINKFIHLKKINKSDIDAIASHGHTVFHQPEKKITLQIGNGHVIASKTDILTITNFREKDVIAGGQGAPLVPIGDLLLYSNMADSFLNLGGFANITSIKQDKIIAFDICPCNLPLNLYASLMGYPYDKNGELGRSVRQNNSGLVELLNALNYYTKPWPKSLGAEWFENEFAPLLEIDEVTAQEKLRICYEHISHQIAKSLTEINSNRVMITGGGAKNKFLIEQIQSKCDTEIVIPDQLIIDFKEAVVFALLGVLKLENVPNCLKSVTGASKDVVGGIIFHP